MGKIKLLDVELTNMISAGEVVERPASVVKELVENAIDAKADSIIVEIKNGGKTYIRVSDNGVGMSLEDARTAFLCHATSKISTKDDLFNISTMGFRGEAVPAIASVSKVELLTASQSEKFGYKLIFEAGRELYMEEVGLGKGTTFIIKDLFFNVPARLKFLKKDATETANIVSLMNKFALGNPDISFKLVVDGKMTLNTQKDSMFLDIIYTVFGNEVTENLLPVNLHEKGIDIVGYVGKPLLCRSNRNYQLFYVNDRIVKNKTVIAALDRAYHNKIMTKKYPVAILKIYVPPREVDVNVHPTKSEVRFTNDQKIFDATYYAIVNALSKENTIEEAKVQPDAQVNVPLSEDELYKQAVENYYNGVNASVVNVGPYDMDVIDTNDEDSNKQEPKQNKYFTPLDDLFRTPHTKSVVDTLKDPGTYSRYAQLPVEELSDEYINDNRNQILTFFETEIVFNYIGELFKTYLIVECGTNFYFIDKHAAHEKILFDKIYDLYKNTDRYAQTLMSGIPVTLTPEENEIVWESKDKIEQIGFSFDKFGKYEIVLRTVPYVMSPADTIPTFIEIVDMISKNKNIEMTDFENRSIKMLACKAAIKAGHATSQFELRQFVEQIIKAGNVNYCPHGRPIICQFSKKGLEKAFKRIV